MGSLPFKVGSSSSVFGHSGSPAVGSPLPFFGGLPDFCANESSLFTHVASGFGYAIYLSAPSSSGIAHSGKFADGSSTGLPLFIF